MTLTILVPLPEHKGYSVEVNLKHTHNHLIIIADALRFRPISEKTKDTYMNCLNKDIQLPVHTLNMKPILCTLIHMY